MDEALIVKTYKDGINAVASLGKDLNGQISNMAVQITALSDRITNWMHGSIRTTATAANLRPPTVLKSQKTCVRSQANEQGGS